MLGLIQLKRATVDMTPTQVHECLSSDRREFTIELIDEMAPTTAGELADEMLRRREGDGVGHSDDRKKYYVGNVQVHLPKLDDWNVIEYDPDSKHVDRGPNLRGLLEAREDTRRRAAAGA